MRSEHHRAVAGKVSRVNHLADLSGISAAARDQWFDLHASLADPRRSELCLRLYPVRSQVDPGTRRPVPTADLLVRAVRDVWVDDDATRQWFALRGISYDAAERSVTISANPPLTITLYVAAVNVRLLHRS